jgi:hypothetical protein
VIGKYLVGLCADITGNMENDENNAAAVVLCLMCHVIVIGLWHSG